MPPMVNKGRNAGKKPSKKGIQSSLPHLEGGSCHSYRRSPSVSKGGSGDRPCEGSSLSPLVPGRRARPPASTGPGRALSLPFFIDKKPLPVMKSEHCSALAGKDSGSLPPKPGMDSAPAPSRQWTTPPGSPRPDRGIRDSPKPASGIGRYTYSLYRGDRK